MSEVAASSNGGDGSQQQQPHPLTKKSNAPPEVITVCDTTVKESCASDSTPTKSDSVSQARTPKHANKQSNNNKNDGSILTKSDVDPHNVSSHHSQQHQRIGPSSSHGGGGSWNGPPPAYQTTSYPPPQSQHFDHGRNGGGAFQPALDRHSYSSQGHAPMQISPGGGRYYYSSNGPSNRFNSNGPPAYDQRYPADFSQVPSYPQHHGGTYGGPPPLYPQQQPQYHGGNNGYERPQTSWGPPPSFPHGRPPIMHHHPEQQQQHFSSRGNGGPHNMMINDRNNANFSRAVSSSFDRSIKSAPERSNQGGGSTEHSPKLSAAIQQQPPQDCGSVSEDASWGALKQVHSVDEEELRRRIAKRKDREKDVIVNQPASNSSSLTNSPTDGVEGKEKRLSVTVNKSSLDSLSSAASAQEPLVSKQATYKAPSPDDSSPSLDLMKCPSGSSALLLPSHHRSLSQLSLGMLSKTNMTRDEYDDERDGVEHGEEHPKNSTEGPVPKRPRNGSKDKKSSPLSITCSPPSTPKGGKKDTKMHQPQALYPQRNKADEASQGFYDKAPSYTYSIESGQNLTRDVRPDSYPTVPRPGSSASSTITPMHVDGSDIRHAPPGVGQIPSWEIHGQDSFGAASVNGGNPLVGSFSFQHDYQMLAPSASADGQPIQVQQHHPSMHPHQALESRNQSFEGGHYHGGFSRSDSMISYEGHQMAYDQHGRPGYQGNFPPHAPSWGSAGSYPAGYVHQQQQRMVGGYPPMMRNYSEDSGARTSPPPPSNMRMMPGPPNFPPPPDFRAPPSMVNKSGPQNTILTSSYPSSPKNGPFGWSKEEDSRLTEIMKKYKNPRDWEPIAKEHNRGRTAKECHERWIRYLKPGVRKGQWTDHEDAVVMEAVTTSTEQPFTRWSDLAQRLPGRVGKQIRDRWVNHLNPAINHLPFSREDDLNLWEGHSQLGKRWVEISTKNFNNTRSENHIKNRWYSASFKKFISNEFGPDAYNGGKSSLSDNDSVDGGSSRNGSSPTRKGDSPNKKKTLLRAASGNSNNGSSSNRSSQQQMDPSQMEAV
jgi:Myb-like DNA-binding domain